MDLFDRQILTVLRDGKSWELRQILQEVGFSHNTLRLHLASLERQGMVVRAKTPKNGPGRPIFIYSLPSSVRQRVDQIITDPYTTIVSLTFQKLRHLCRYEKGGYCKKLRKGCASQNCPQILKNE